MHAEKKDQTDDQCRHVHTIHPRGLVWSAARAAPKHDPALKNGHVANHVLQGGRGNRVWITIPYRDVRRLSDFKRARFLVRADLARGPCRVGSQGGVYVDSFLRSERGFTEG